MIISTALKPLFRILQITCLAPFNLTKTNKFYKSYFMMFYSIVLILMSLSVLTSVTFKRYSILETDVFISGNIMSVVHLIGIWISHLITLIESLIKRRQQIEFLEKLREIDYIFEKRIGYNFKYKSLQRSIIFHMIGWGSLYTLLESYLFILLLDVDYKFGRFLRNWAIHMIPFSFCCLRYFQVITYVLFLKLRFRFLNKSLVETKHEIENLTLLKSVYSKLWNLSNLINQSFGLSILINIATNFISITINFYFVFLSLKMNHNPKDILEALWSYGDILWLIPYLLNVFMLAKVCHATADIVSCFLLNFDEENHFSIQFQGQQCSFNCPGC